MEATNDNLLPLERFAAGLRKQREDRGLTQEEFAELLGVHRTYIGGLERAERDLMLTTADRLAARLGVTSSQLMTSG